ncbi:acyltransferase [Corynebacterium sp. 320]|uniref:acyltransferase family protein n=1 Tax=Corynebacterium TaxID=1716 RepID=UPI00125CC8EC|nr:MULTISPECIES: acyltransferase family protein [Corynebacterium]KAB1502722.1 acyltransferase [Corynebacterium sp. 320]KAB1550540.1 acyltransferase [Corynebacterium sp. 319]KAB1554733.1 acyltransferase [Corynebacterium sp. 321]KAB3526385.1 acyltransferase [Corynebacterium sp. 250]KAB3537770.1 acyltransferase [Corynebacterium sp. 366]
MSSSTSGNSTPTRRFRTDIEGLRGFAIALVVVFHVFVGRVSSGVDVFLLLGGVFFFSGQLNNALNPKGQTLLQSLVRIIRRLYPHLVVVVAATLGGGLIALSTLQHSNLAHDAVASLGYFQNWSLANTGREYAAIQQQVSPYQHLWSMAVQFQIYVGSLLFIWLFALVVRKYSRPIFTVTLVVATLASFIYATWLHVDDQTLNYYSTFSRFWEIGLGGLLGIVITSRRSRTRTDGSPALLMARAPRWTRWVMGVVGIAGIIFTGLFLDGAHQFPGPWTLIPLLGTVLIVLAGTGTEYETAGTDGKAIAVNRLLESAPFQFFGRISYGLYLWHWPLLVLALNLSGRTQVPALLGLLVIAGSIALAWITMRVVEKPLRQQSKQERSWVKLFSGVKPFKVAAAVALAGIVAAVLYAPTVVDSRARDKGDLLWQYASNADMYPGARANVNNEDVRANLPLVPPLEDFDALTPQTAFDGCSQGFTESFLVLTQDYNRSPVPCAYGDVHSDRTLYLVGASHSEHFLPALDVVMKSRGIKLVPLMKMACPINSSLPLADGSPNPTCPVWSEAVMQYIHDNPPTEGIFMTGTRPTGLLGQGPEVVPDEFLKTVQQFDSWGIHSYLVRDNVWFMNNSDDSQGLMDMRLCVADMMEGKRGENDAGSGYPGVHNEMSVTSEEISEINSVCGNTVRSRLEEINPATGSKTAASAWGKDSSPEVSLRAHESTLAQGTNGTTGTSGTGGAAPMAGLVPTGYVDPSGNRFYVNSAGAVFYTTPAGALYQQDAYGNSMLVSSAPSKKGDSSSKKDKGASSSSTSRSSSATSTSSSSSETATSTESSTSSDSAEPERDSGTKALPNNGAYKGLSVTNLDLTPVLCRDNWCPGIIGNVVVYRDSHHYTNVFARTLAQEIERQMFGSVTVD